MNPALVIALAAAVIGPLVAYLGASRKLSGKIGTSEAADLWAESGKIRDDYRARIDVANVRQAELESRVARLEGENNTLVRENISLHARIDTLERENAELKQQIAELLEEIHAEKKA
jgi:predicted  nucleic acid-binding Zn-ribbon protein